MTDTVRIQHYVPRFYLKQFSIRKGKEQYVYCFDKSQRKQFEVNIRRVGCESYFYTAAGADQTTEEVLRKIESKFSVIYR
jgi:hypothetical protein